MSKDHRAELYLIIRILEYVHRKTANSGHLPTPTIERMVRALEFGGTPKDTAVAYLLGLVQDATKGIPHRGKTPHRVLQPLQRPLEEPHP